MPLMIVFLMYLPLCNSINSHKRELDFISFFLVKAQHSGHLTPSNPFGDFVVTCLRQSWQKLWKHLKVLGSFTDPSQIWHFTQSSSFDMKLAMDSCKNRSKARTVLINFAFRGVLSSACDMNWPMYRNFEILRLMF